MKRYRKNEVKENGERGRLAERGRGKEKWVVRANSISSAIA